MKILLFSTLFPNKVLPNHGIFVQQRLKKLLEYDTSLEVKVLAPVPWFPSSSEKFGEYGKYAKVDHFEQRFGVEIFHPRYPVIPKVGMSLAPLLLYLAAKSKVKKLIESGFDFDLIDAHYFYPDGVAAVMLAKTFNKPVAITGRGTDLNLIPQYAIPAKQIRWAANNASAMITVASALIDYLENLGIDRKKVVTLRNGVDLEKFRPADNRGELRKKLGIHGKTILSAGFLVERKGHYLIVDALKQLPGISLLIAGSGEDQEKLEAQVESSGLIDRVKFLGRLPQEKLREYYQAVDALILASSREGWANVLLESMACGTPVVATAIDGTPEVVKAPEAGVLILERNSQSIAESINKLFENYPDRQETRRYAEKFSWDETSKGQIELFEIISRP